MWRHEAARPAVQVGEGGEQWPGQPGRPARLESLRSPPQPNHRVEACSSGARMAGKQKNIGNEKFLNLIKVDVAIISKSVRMLHCRDVTGVTMHFTVCYRAVRLGRRAGAWAGRAARWWSCPAPPPQIPCSGEIGGVYYGLHILGNLAARKLYLTGCVHAGTAQTTSLSSPAPCRPSPTPPPASPCTQSWRSSLSTRTSGLQSSLQCWRR